MAKTKVVSDSTSHRRRSTRHATPPKIEIDDEQEIKNESGVSESESKNENGSEEKTPPKAKAKAKAKAKTKRGLTNSLPPAELRRSKRAKSENDLKQPMLQIKEEEKGRQTLKNGVKVEAEANSRSLPASSPPVKAETEDNDSNAHKLTEITSPSKSKATDLQAKKLKSYAQFAGVRQSPFPEFARPLPEECRRAHQILASLHGQRTRPEELKAPTLRAGCGDSASVLDALVRTILSQNTSDSNSSRAKLSMDRAYGGSDAWEAIVAGGQAKLAKTIESGGLAVVKSKVILSILEQTHDKYGVYSLDHLFEASDEDAMREMLAFKGVGPKTASCVLLFCLRRASFAVDTHVHRITGLLGWRPPAATRDQTHAHLDARIPDEDKYGLHVLIVRHGKDCAECKAGGKNLGKCELRKAFRRGKMEGRAGEEAKEEEGGGENGDDGDGDRKVKME